uniref:ATPase P n=1 Tax=Desulfobacca acetoxidans TaxID=60893 RepID=A0A7V4G6X8_9BACT
MLTLDIPGFKTLRLRHLVLDFNGTLAQDGRLLPGVAGRLELLSRSLALHILTADTHGTVQAQVGPLNAALIIIGRDQEAEAKVQVIRRLDETATAAIGNGNNDRLMLAAAALGIAVCQPEGLAITACLAADLIVPDILSGLDLLLNPQRLLGTLRT